MTQGPFLSGVLQVWIQSFPSPRLVAFTKAEEYSLPYYFTYSLRENNQIYTFRKSISAMWNAISHVQNLNSRLRIHFQRR